MNRSTMVIVIVLIVACLWFGSVFTTCSPGTGGGFGGGFGGIWPVFIGGSGWDRGGWDRSSPSGSPSSPLSPSRSSGGGLRGGGISGGRGGK